MLQSWDYYFIWIFGIGSDLYDDTITISTDNISRMSEHNQLLCNIIGQNRICAQNYVLIQALSLSPFRIGASQAVNWREQILNAQGKPISIMSQERKKRIMS